MQQARDLASLANRIRSRHLRICCSPVELICNRGVVNEVRSLTIFPRERSRISNFTWRLDMALGPIFDRSSSSRKHREHFRRNERMSHDRLCYWCATISQAFHPQDQECKKSHVCCILMRPHASIATRSVHRPYMKTNRSRDASCQVVARCQTRRVMIFIAKEPTECVVTPFRRCSIAAEDQKMLWVLLYLHQRPCESIWHSLSRSANDEKVQNVLTHVVRKRCRGS